MKIAICDDNLNIVDEVFEQNRMRMAQYAVTKSQQVESPTATN